MRTLLANFRQRSQLGAIVSVRRSVTATALLLIFILAGGRTTLAQPVTFDLAWSGASLGNTAEATGFVTVDIGLLPNPGAGVTWGVEITDFELTVSGAASGNGTFTFADFDSAFWDTGGATLDLCSDLVGQPTGAGPWGDPGCIGNGDFNVFGIAPGAPVGTFCFELTTDSGFGDTMLLTSFAPQQNLVNFALAYSGASFGNTAEATGFVTVDTNKLPNPGATPGFIPFGAEITDFEITVTGTTSGNGTFTLADFGSVIWDTGGATLNLGFEVVGQPTSAGPWGDPGCIGNGDFNVLAATPGAPSGTFCFELTTDGGDPMLLTSFLPTVRTFDLAWSGDSFGNKAEATGFIAVDTNALPNPGSTGFGDPFGVEFLDFGITVIGSGAGDGMFTVGDFSGVVWDTNGGTLDLNSELVGQPTSGDPWGTPSGGGGDFNVFAGGGPGPGPGAPNGSDFFTLSTGSGDQILLTNFRPQLLGDVNCDGAVNLLDVDPFIVLLTSGGFLNKADINGDGAVNLLDVDPFIGVISP